jgi:hypothetical protein
MEFRKLYIFVEGDDDELFFERIIKPLFEKKYGSDSVEVRKYAKMKKEKVVAFLRSIRSMKADYIFTTDINTAPCISGRKEKVKNKFDGHVTGDRIAVVIKEIESWYLAGVNDEFRKKCKISSYSATDNITKEQFNSYIPKKFGSRINFMVEILEHFSVEIAKQRNRSFRYFLKKYDREF